MSTQEAINRAKFKYMTTKVKQKHLRFYPKDMETWEKVKDLTSGQIIEILKKSFDENNNQYN